MDQLQVEIVEMGWLQVSVLMACEILRSVAHRQESLHALAVDAWNAFRRGGWSHFMHWYIRAYTGDRSNQSAYRVWVQSYDTLDESARASIRRRIDSFARKPVISVIMATRNSNLDHLCAAIDSVRGQLYPAWELCIADDASSSPAILDLLRSCAAKDSRIKLAFCDAPGQVAEASNTALSLASGEFATFFDDDDLLAEDALFHVALESERFPDADLFYSDDDKLDLDGARCEPNFKPDWNPDLLLGQNYLHRLAVYRMRLLHELNGLRSGFDGSQDWDVALRAIERLDASRIRHIPRVLYHWRVSPGSMSLGQGDAPHVRESQRHVLADHLQRRGIAAIVEPNGANWRIRRALPSLRPRVSVIVPTRDHADLLRACIESIRSRSTYGPVELVIVDNGSKEPATLAYLSELAATAGARVIRDDRPFNYAALMNRAVAHASGEIVALVNNDIEVLSPDWLEEMVSHALRSEVGAVGCMLYYPNWKIQHGGMIVGATGVARHAYVWRSRGDEGYSGRGRLVQNLSAVTGACIVIRRDVYREVGGMDEEHVGVAFNDIDFCLRLRAAGYRIVWTPHAELIHHESASRGSDETPERVGRFRRELEWMRERWEPELRNDPAYNPNLAVDCEPFELAFPPRTPRGRSCVNERR